MATRISLALTISAMLIAALLPAHVSTTRAQAGRAVWEEVGGIPQTVSLADVVMLSTTSAWAVGSEYRDGGYRGLVYHLTLREGQWHAAVDTALDDAPLAISARSGSTIWVVGENGLIARRDAAGWQQMPGGATGPSLRALAMTPDGADGWAAGERRTSTASTGPILLRYANGQWAPDPGITGDAGGGIDGLSFAGGSGWAAGNPGIWRFANGRWEREPLPGLCEGCYTDMSDVHALSAEEAWAVGTRSPICQGCDFSLYVLHRSGGAWQPMLPDARLGDELRETSMLHGIDFADGNHGWAVGNLGNGDNRPLLLSYRGGTWAYDQVPLWPGRLTAVSAADASHALAVGDNGIVFSYGYRRPAPDERCFAETGQCISGRFREYWEQNGGLAIFGFPITPQRTETVEGTWTGPVQWFERDRLEDHTNEGKGILAGRLGARWLEVQGRPWQTFPGAPGPGDPKQCTFFAQTGHLLCGRFRTYWERHGGLERFGYPITEVFNERVEGRELVVQYFERRRMEYHPELEGTPYEVLLGLLGRDLHARIANAWFFTPVPAYEPLAPATYHRGAAQRFEHGFILWTEDPDVFYIFVEDRPYWIVRAPYTFQPAPRFDETPPPGRFVPVSGFGRLWRGELANLGPGAMPEPPRTLLGWAIEPEHPYMTEYQCHGGPNYAAQRCYLRGPSGEVIWFGPPGWGRWP